MRAVAESPPTYAKGRGNGRVWEGGRGYGTPLISGRSVIGHHGPKVTVAIAGRLETWAAHSRVLGPWVTRDRLGGAAPTPLEQPIALGRRPSMRIAGTGHDAGAQSLGQTFEDLRLRPRPARSRGPRAFIGKRRTVAVSSPSAALIPLQLVPSHRAVVDRRASGYLSPEPPARTVDHGHSHALPVPLAASEARAPSNPPAKGRLSHHATARASSRTELRRGRYALAACGRQKPLSPSTRRRRVPASRAAGPSEASTRRTRTATESWTAPVPRPPTPPSRVAPRAVGAEHAAAPGRTRRLRQRLERGRRLGRWRSRRNRPLERPIVDSGPERRSG